MTQLVRQAPPKIRPAVTFASNAVLAAAGNATVFLAGANVNGAWVWGASMWSASNGVTPSALSLLAKATAPTAFADGQCILAADNGFSNGGSQNLEGGRIVVPIFIPAGLGLFWHAVGAETYSRKVVQYTLLF